MRAVPHTPPPVLLLDAGNVLVCLDGVAVSGVLARAGFDVAPEVIEAAEAPAKLHYERQMRMANTTHDDAWVGFVAGILQEAGIDKYEAWRLVLLLQKEHEQFNLWRRVPPGVHEALAALRAAGVRLGVVSNSEGQLARLLARLELGRYFEHIVDSGVEGVCKPGGAIFERALTRLGVTPGDAMYAGDIPQVDVEGARGAGVRAVLIDSANAYPDYTDALRFGSLLEMVRAIFRVAT